MSDFESNAAEAVENVMEANQGESEATSGIDELNQENFDPNLASQEQVPTTEGELANAVDKAIEDGASEEEIKDMIREFEVKVNGKKRKVKVDLNDEEALKRHIQMAEAGKLSMQENAELKKFLESEAARAKQNPWDFLADLGLDPDELAEQRIAAKIEEMKKSPEQIEREKLQKELAEARAELERQQKQKEDAERIALQEKHAVELDKEITDVLAQHPTLPKSRKTVGRIADAMLWAMDNGWDDVSVADVIPSVEAEIKSEMNEFMSSLPEDFIEAYIGKNVMEKLRKSRLAAAQKAMEASSTNNIKKVSTEKKPEIKETKQTKKAKDFFRTL